MKRIGLVLGIATTLCTTTINAGAHGGCFGPCFWPLWPLSFGVGVALGSASCDEYYGYPRYMYSQPYYAYSYTQPSYMYGSPARSPSPLPPTTTVTQQPAWVPSTPGVGHWVPDPAPYTSPAIIGGASARISSGTNEIVTITRSVGNIPVYMIEH